MLPNGLITNPLSFGKLLVSGLTFSGESGFLAADGLFGVIVAPTLSPRLAFCSSTLVSYVLQDIICCLRRTSSAIAIEGPERPEPRPRVGESVFGVRGLRCSAVLLVPGREEVSSISAMCSWNFEVPEDVCESGGRWIGVPSSIATTSPDGFEGRVYIVAGNMTPQPSALIPGGREGGGRSGSNRPASIILAFSPCRYRLACELLKPRANPT